MNKYQELIYLFSTFLFFTAVVMFTYLVPLFYLNLMYTNICDKLYTTNLVIDEKPEIIPNIAESCSDNYNSKLALYSLSLILMNFIGNLTEATLTIYFYYRKHYPQQVPQLYLDILQVYNMIRTLIGSVAGYYVVPLAYLYEGPSTNNIFLTVVSFQWYYNLYEFVSVLICSLAHVFSTKKYERDYQDRKLIRYYYDCSNATLLTPWALPVLQALVFPAMFFSWFLRTSFRYDYRPRLNKDYPK